MRREEVRAASADTAHPDRAIALMIVGTPRSGTTLVQRTVSERCGLPTVPETHLFTVFAPRLLKTTRLPLVGADLMAALEWYVSLKQHQGGAPPAEALFQRLDGRLDSLTEMFVAVVSELAGGSSNVVEKTPDHLLWLRHLATSLPDTSFIAVVRDPRAVFASTMKVHWGQQNPVMAAERWSRDQRSLVAMHDVLGPERLMLLRYEDLVLDEAATVERIRDFVGHGVARTSAHSTVFRDHELGWKARAADPVTAERLTVWEESIPEDTVARIEEICGEQMSHFGYERSTSGPFRLGPSDRSDRIRYRFRRIAHEQRIRRSYAPRARL